MICSTALDEVDFECFSELEPCRTDHPSSACIHSMLSTASLVLHDTTSDKKNISVSLCAKPFDPTDGFTQVKGHFWEINFSLFNESNDMKGISLNYVQKYHFQK